MQTPGTLLSKKEKEEKVKAGITTGIITLLILLLLILVGFKTTKEDEGGGGGGVEVQMGDPNQGGPDDSPLSERIVPVTPQQVESADYALTNQDGVDVNQQQKPRQTTQTQTPPKPEPPKIESALEKAMREARESRGQGTGPATGTQGEQEGTGTSPTGGSGGTGGTGGTGNNKGPGGDGDGFKLGQGFGNRSISYKPNITSKCTDAKGGRVIFKVEVAPNGSVVKVLNPSTGERGTNVSDPCLMREAVDLVKKVRLSAISESINTIGEITITIKN